MTREGLKAKPWVLKQLCPCKAFSAIREDGRMEMDIWAGNGGEMLFVYYIVDHV